MFKRDDILADLRDNVAEVTFRLADGTPLRQRVTLMPELLPPNYNARHLHEQHLKPENLRILVCWDVDSKKWTSFPAEAVEVVQIVANY